MNSFGADKNGVRLRWRLHCLCTSACTRRHNYLLGIGCCEFSMCCTRRSYFLHKTLRLYVLLYEVYEVPTSRICLLLFFIVTNDLFPCGGTHRSRRTGRCNIIGALTLYSDGCFKLVPPTRRYLTSVKLDVSLLILLILRSKNRQHF